MSYYAVIFTSKRNRVDPIGYSEMSQKMIELAKSQKGFIDFESVRNVDGNGITISYWDSLESIKLWKQDKEHLVAQKMGRKKWYDKFHVRICKVEKEYNFELERKNKLTPPQILYEVEGIQIRSAKIEDASEIANVHLNAWRESYKGQLDQSFLDDMPLSFKRRMKYWEKYLENNFNLVFVAESKHGIIGFNSIKTPGRDKDLYDCAEIEAIYLLEKFKGKKIGLHLLKAGFQAMRNSGYSKAYCWMLKGNRTGKFYESTGGKLSGKEKTGILNGKDEIEVMYFWETIVS